MGKYSYEKFLVGGLFSEEGEKEVEHNLIQIDGVVDVNVSLMNGLVEVNYDESVISSNYLFKTLDSLGHSPRVAGEKQA